MTRTLKNLARLFRAREPDRAERAEHLTRLQSAGLVSGSVPTQLEMVSFPATILPQAPPNIQNLLFPWQATFSNRMNAPLLEHSTTSFPITCSIITSELAGWAYNLGTMYQTTGIDLTIYPPVPVGMPVIINIGRPMPLGPIGTGFQECLGAPVPDPVLNPQFPIWFYHWTDPLTKTCTPQPG